MITNGRTTFAWCLRCVCMGALMQTAACAQIVGIEEPINVEESVPNFEIYDAPDFVYDHNTKLVWQRGDHDTAFDWKGSNDLCMNLVHGGYDDWRLPLLVELASIVDYRKTDPAIDTDKFRDAVTMEAPYTKFWSSTKGEDSRAYFVDFKDGSIGSDAVTEFYLVRCVVDVSLDH